MEVKANGKTFTVPDGTPTEAIGTLIDEYFADSSNVDHGQWQEDDVISATATGDGGAQEIIDNRRSTLETITDPFTGADRMTKSMENLPEIGNAPELSEMSMKSFRTSLAPMLTGDETDLESIFKSNWGDDVNFREDEKGNKIVDFPSGTYALNKPGLSGQDWARGLLEAVTFGKGSAMAGAGKTLLRGAAKQGAVAGAIETANELGDTALGGTFDGGDVALATGFGAGGQALSDVTSAVMPSIKQNLGVFGNVPETVGETFGRMKDKVKSYKRAKGEAMPIDIEDTKLMNTGTPDEIINAGENYGIPVMTSDVMPSESFIGGGYNDLSSKIPVIGTAGTRTSQRGARDDAIKTMENKYGDFSDEAIIQGLKDSRDRGKQAAGKRLSEIENDIMSYQLPNTPAMKEGAGKIGGKVFDDSGTMASIRKASEDLQKEGVITNNAALSDLNELLTPMLTGEQTFNTLRLNRTKFNSIIESIDPAARSQLRGIDKATLDSVAKAMTQDLETAVRRSAILKHGRTPASYANKSEALAVGDKAVRRWKQANKYYANFAEEQKKSKLKNILDKGDTIPESYRSMLFSKDKSVGKMLYRNLTIEGRENARGAIISEIAALSKGSPAMFKNNLAKFSKQIDTFFKGEDKRQLQGLYKVLKATQNADNAAAVTPTGQTVLFPSLAILWGANPVAGGSLTAGVLGNKLYNSAPVRDALIAVGKMKKDLGKGFEKSPEFIKLLNVLQTAAKAMDGGVNYTQGAAQAIQGSQLEN